MSPYHTQGSTLPRVSLLSARGGVPFTQVASAEDAEKSRSITRRLDRFLSHRDAERLQNRKKVVNAGLILMGCLHALIDRTYER
jgi:hypothetical protein